MHAVAQKERPVHQSIAPEHARIVRGSVAGWEEFRRSLQEGARNDLVDVQWDVTYEPLGHDMILQAAVKTLAADDVLLQLWLKDQHPGIWIPEFRPWVASVVEFEPAQQVRAAKVGLIDSKWRPEDTGATYTALAWGYFRHEGTTQHFALERSFVYPG
jgi:hypothetical protein